MRNGDWLNLLRVKRYRARSRLPLYGFLYTCGICFPNAYANAQGIAAVSVDVENDYFNVWRPANLRSDDNYTQGIHIGVWFASAPRWLRRSVPACAQLGRAKTHQETCASSGILVGQELYTPTNDAPMPLPGERPYAAVLYTDLSFAPMSQNTLRVYSLRFGTTGPLALGEKTQVWFHQVGQFRTPLGWKHQIKAQSVIGAKYEYHRLALNLKRTPSTRMTLVPSGSLTIGNLLVVAKGAVEARVGYRAPHPWLGSDEAISGARAYLVAGAQEEWIAHSLLLEGNTSETQDLVKKRATVTQWHVGFCMGISRASIEFRTVTRTKEYATGPPRHVWGTIALTYTLYQ